ncbi:NVEALA domain-containing protein [Bacteroides heparinolyticus]|uniref:NVEALA domain-containing protein n=1 Tax=Prevotella heparinolytica TaxID=28113 RepID=UPI0035A15113
MKLYVKMAFVAAFVAIAGYGVYANHKVEEPMSDLMLANVEALASREGGGVIKYQTMGTCSMWGGITYKCTSKYTAERCRLDC